VRFAQILFAPNRVRSVKPTVLMGRDRSVFWGPLVARTRAVVSAARLVKLYPETRAGRTLVGVIRVTAPARVTDARVVSRRLPDNLRHSARGASCAQGRLIDDDRELWGHGLVLRREVDAASGTARQPHLISRLIQLLANRKIPILLEHRVRRLIQLPDWTVVGLDVDTPYGTRRMLARRGVIFASGGFTRSPAYSRQFLAVPLDGARALGPKTKVTSFRLRWQAD
jgi:hypothetical protein